MNEKTVKRSIRIPKELHNKLGEEARIRQRSVNQIILEKLGAIYRVKIEDRIQGRRW